jgi:hypothetical protein
LERSGRQKSRRLTKKKKDEVKYKESQGLKRVRGENKKGEGGREIVLCYYVFM